jgi:hypothetical protein
MGQTAAQIDNQHSPGHGTGAPFHDERLLVFQLELIERADIVIEDDTLLRSYGSSLYRK